MDTAKCAWCTLVATSMQVKRLFEGFDLKVGLRIRSDLGSGGWSWWLRDSTFVIIRGCMLLMESPSNVSNTYLVRLLMLFYLSENLHCCQYNCRRANIGWLNLVYWSNTSRGEVINHILLAVCSCVFQLKPPVQFNIEEKTKGYIMWTRAWTCQ